LKSCALHSASNSGICGSADVPDHILEKCESQDPKFYKEYLKLMKEEPKRLMPDEMEKLITSDRSHIQTSFE